MNYERKIIVDIFGEFILVGGNTIKWMNMKLSQNTSVEAWLVMESRKLFIFMLIKSTF